MAPPPTTIAAINSFKEYPHASTVGSKPALIMLTILTYWPEKISAMFATRPNAG